MAKKLAWQSKVILMISLLPTAALVASHFALHGSRAWNGSTGTALWIVAAAIGLAIGTRSATLPAAAAGGVLMVGMLLDSIRTLPVDWTRTPLPALLVVIFLTALSTRFRRERKRNPQRTGRNAAQIAANLGVAALTAALPLATGWRDPSSGHASGLPAALAGMGGAAMLVAALAEAAADTMSSELGEVLGGPPYLITTGRAVPPGTDGAVSVAGTAAGVLGALAVVAAALPALHGSFGSAWRAAAGAIAGLFFDSLLGATLERRGWLNNDAVNFLSTIVAATVALGLTGRMI